MLQKVTIPSNVTSIGNRAFSSCASLSCVIIHDGVKSIGDVAFYSCENLMSVTLPSSVETIGFEAFGYVSGGNNLKINGFTIKCADGSAAMDYAVENGLEYILLDSEVILSDTSEYAAYEDVISGVTPGTSINDFKEAFISSVIVKDRNGNEITSGAVCTGYTVSSGSSTLNIAVSGDANGDGGIDSLDAVYCLKNDAGIIELSGAYEKAADINGDGCADSLDAVKLFRIDAGIDQ